MVILAMSLESMVTLCLCLLHWFLMLGSEEVVDASECCKNCQFEFIHKYIHLFIFDYNMKLIDVKICNSKAETTVRIVSKMADLRTTH